MLFRVAGIAPPIDGVTPAFDDPAPALADTRRALQFGFTARLLIHPRQVEPVHRALRPPRPSSNGPARSSPSPGTGAP